MTHPEVFLETFHARYQSLVLGILSGKGCAWPQDVDSPFNQYFLKQTRCDGIQLLIHRIVSLDSSWGQWPGEIRESLQAAAKNDAVIDWVRQQDCQQLIQAMQGRGIEPILLKGGALSLTHYPEPYLRTRNDTDILVPSERFNDARAIMQSMGCESSNLIEGDLVNYQAAYHKKGAQGVNFFYDLHAKLLNPHEFKSTLIYEEIIREAVIVDMGPVKVKVPSERHMLLHACLHRVAHHYENPKLIWFYDVYLLLKGKRREWLEDFYALAASKKVRKVCGATLESAEKYFPTGLPAGWVQRFTQCADFEPTQKFLDRKQSTLSIFWFNFRSLPPGEAWRFLWQQLFPPVSFIKAKYVVKKGWMVPAFYFWRIVAGIPSLFRRLSG